MAPSKFIVGGSERSSDKSRRIVNPYNGEVVGEVYQAGANDIGDAIASAVKAFNETRRLHSYQRADVLSFISNRIAQDKEKIARLITAETGKPIAFSRTEVDRSVFTFQYAAEEAKRLEGAVLPLDTASHSPGRWGIVRRFPLGVVGAITPFNFPINLVAHKLAPAIASGNSFVLKPSSNAPLTAIHLGGILLNSGYPKAAVNIVPCSGSEAGQLITDERIKLLSFTGSPAVGWPLKSAAGKKKVVLELGGNAGVIVDEGVDIPSVARRIAIGAYGNAGQSCIAVQRVYVHKSIFDRFLSEFIEVSKTTKVGDPLDESTVVGPMIDEQAASKISEWIEEAVRSGAGLLCGGKGKGAVLEPTVLSNVDRHAKVSCQEVFAPVTVVERFDRFEDAVRMVNDSDFGLQAGVFTDQLSHALHAYNELEVGGVIVNDYPTYRIDSMPYGGVKDSGFGREGIKYAIEEMTESKLLVINPQSMK